MPNHTERRGAPPRTPTRITVTLHHSCAQRIKELAAEMGVTPSAYCAHVLERWTLQDAGILANDIVVERLTTALDRQLAQFTRRLGEAVLHDLHETVALRHMLVRQIERNSSAELASKVQRESWAQAVSDLRDQVRRVRGRYEDDE